MASYVYPDIQDYAKKLNKEVQEVDTLGFWTPYPVGVLPLQWVDKEKTAGGSSNQASTKVNPLRSS